MLNTVALVIGWTVMVLASVYATLDIGLRIADRIIKHTRTYNEVLAFMRQRIAARNKKRSEQAGVAQNG